MRTCISPILIHLVGEDMNLIYCSTRSFSILKLRVESLVLFCCLVLESLVIPSLSLLPSACLPLHRIPRMISGEDLCEEFRPHQLEPEASGCAEAKGFLSCRAPLGLHPPSGHTQKLRKHPVPIKTNVRILHAHGF